MSRRMVAVTVLAAVAFVLSPPVPSPVDLVASAGASVVDPAGAVPDDAGNSIGSPNAGPRPERPGDRGGWAQLSILGLLIVAVTFIMWRIFHEARGGRPVRGS